MRFKEGCTRLVCTGLIEGFAEFDENSIALEGSDRGYGRLYCRGFTGFAQVTA